MQKKKKMKQLITFFLAVIPLVLQSCGNIDDEYVYGKGLYTIDWQAAADSSSVSLINRFWNAQEGYFNYNNDQADGWNEAYNYWPQAHAMDVVVDAYLRTNDTRYSALFDAWYEGIKKKSSGVYWNNFYDDMEWIALTMIRLHEATGQNKYLQTAYQLWEWIKEGWNDYAGGGIAWNHDEPWSKNACSNGPAGLIAARLYHIDGNNDHKDWAIRIYQWERDHLFNPATGAVYDNENGLTNEVNQLSLSYNQGTFLGLAHELYQITGEDIYLKDARRAANFGISDTSMIDAGNNVLRDEGDGDGGLFKGIFMRYFVKLVLEKNLEAAYQKKFATFLSNNAEVLWRQVVNKLDLLYGTSWTQGAEGSTQLSSHTSGCTLIEAKAYYETLRP